MNIENTSKLSPSRLLTILLMLKPYNINPNFLAKIDLLFSRLSDFSTLSKGPVKVLLQSEILGNSEFLAFLHKQIELRGKQVQPYKLVFETDQPAKAEQITTANPEENEANLESPTVKSEVVDPEELRLVICFGGDGVIFHANRILRSISPDKDIRAPFLAVNLGTLGFMSQFLAKDLERALDIVIPQNSENPGQMRVLKIPKLKFEIWDNGKGNQRLFLELSSG